MSYNSYKTFIVRTFVISGFGFIFDCLLLGGTHQHTSTTMSVISMASRVCKIAASLLLFVAWFYRSETEKRSDGGLVGFNLKIVSVLMTQLANQLSGFEEGQEDHLYHRTVVYLILWGAYLTALVEEVIRAIKTLKQSELDVLEGIHIDAEPCPTGIVLSQKERERRIEREGDQNAFKCDNCLRLEGKLDLLEARRKANAMAVLQLAREQMKAK